MSRSKVKSCQLSTFISGDEVLTSSQLLRRLRDHFGGNESANRTRLARATNTPAVWRSNSLLLPKNQRLFTRRTFFRSPQFFTTVATVLETERPGLSRLLHCLGKVEFLHETQARKLLAAPVQESGAFPGLERDLLALNELGVSIRKCGSHRYVCRSDPLDARVFDASAELTLGELRRESLLTRVLVNRLARQNMLSWNGTNLPCRDQLGSEFNNQLFTAFGFSYLSPLLQFKDIKPSPCPVLFEVYAGECSKKQVESFVHRSERAVLRRGKGRRFLGVIAARWFVKDAWDYARERGIMAINLVQMFGDEALEAMALAEQLMGGFQNEAITHDLTSLFAAIGELKTNPVVVDLYSIGFEAFAGLALRDRGYGELAFGTIVPFQKTTRDVDVHARKQNELTVIESKAYHAKKPLDPSEVKKFFTETLPSYIAWWRARNGNREPDRVRAEIWTTGSIGKDAEDKLAELNLKPYVVPKFCGQKEMLEGLSFEIGSRMGQFLSAIAKGGEL